MGQQATRWPVQAPRKRCFGPLAAGAGRTGARGRCPARTQSSAARRAALGPPGAPSGRPAAAPHVLAPPRPLLAPFAAELLSGPPGGLGSVHRSKIVAVCAPGGPRRASPALHLQPAASGAAWAGRIPPMAHCSGDPRNSALLPDAARSFRRPSRSPAQPSAPCTPIGSLQPLFPLSPVLSSSRCGCSALAVGQRAGLVQLWACAAPARALGPACAVHDSPTCMSTAAGAVHTLPAPPPPPAAAAASRRCPCCPMPPVSPHSNFEAGTDTMADSWEDWENEEAVSPTTAAALLLLLLLPLPCCCLPLPCRRSRHCCCCLPPPLLLPAAAATAGPPVPAAMR